MSFDQNAGHDMSDGRVDEKRGYDSIDTFSMTGLSVDTDDIDMESTTGMSFSTANTDIKFVSKVKNDSQYNDADIHNNSLMLEKIMDLNAFTSANIDSNHVDSKLMGFQPPYAGLSNNSLFIEEIVPQKNFDLFTTSLFMKGHLPQEISSENSSSADDSLNLDQKLNTPKLEGSSQSMSTCSKVTDLSESIVSVSEKKEYGSDANKHNKNKTMRYGSDLADGKSIPNQVTGLERQASQISTLTEGKSVTTGLRSLTTSGSQMMSTSSGRNRRYSKSSQRASAFNSIDDLLPIRERSLEEVPNSTDGKSIPNQVTDLERKASQISSLTDGKSVTAGLRSSTTSNNQMMFTSSDRTQRSSKSSRSSSSFINIDDLSSVNENMSVTDSGISIENKFEKWKQEIPEWQDGAEREDSQIQLIEEELQAYKEVDNMNEMASMMSDTRFY